MKLTREELLKQRALVEEQLRWIDAKLAESETESRGTAPLPEPITASQSEPAKTEKPEQSIPSVVEFASDGPAEGVTTNQKAGCLILVVIVCAGILAALFALPYLLY